MKTQEKPYLRVVNQNPDILLPPQCVEAEESLFSGIFLNNKYLPDIVDYLKPEHFYRNSHKIIFSACLYLHELGEPVDIVTVAEHCVKKKVIKQITGRGYEGHTYLGYLANYDPGRQNVEHYAKLIYDNAKLREMLIKAETVRQLCYSGKTPDEIIDTSQKEICSVNLSRIDSEISNISSVGAEVIEDIDRQQKTGVTGLMTGYEKFDRITGGLQATDLIILAGRPGMGKTSFACNLIKKLCENQHETGLFSMEMSKKQIAKLRLIPMITGIDSMQIRSGNLSKKDWGRIVDAGGELDSWPLWIDDTPKMHYRELNRKARIMVKKYGVKSIFIDQLTFLQGDMVSGRTDIAVRSITRNCKQLAKELDIPIVLLNQLNRQVEQRADKKPILSDLREGGEEDADMVIFLYRDEVYNKDENNPLRGLAEAIIAKQRSGGLSTIGYNFHKSVTLFSEVKS